MNLYDLNSWTVDLVERTASHSGGAVATFKREYETAEDWLASTSVGIERFEGSVYRCSEAEFAAAAKAAAVRLGMTHRKKLTA